MDPVQSAVTAFLNAIQASQPLPDLPVAPQAVLNALLGQDVNLIFQGKTDAGLQFTLPSGQNVTAQGDFAYPPGTQLLVRVGQADAGGIRLQTLQALPPAPPGILAPLLQGEAQALQTRLTQPDPPPELEPLVQLFQLLGGALPSEAASTPAGGTVNQPVPGQPDGPAGPAAPPSGAQASSQPGAPSANQPAIQAENQLTLLATSQPAGTNPAVPPGTNPAVPPGTNPAVPPGANPAAPPGTNPAVPPGTNPAVTQGINPAVPPGTNPAVPLTVGQLTTQALDQPAAQATSLEAANQPNAQTANQPTSQAASPTTSQAPNQPASQAVIAQPAASQSVPQAASQPGLPASTPAGPSPQAGGPNLPAGATPAVQDLTALVQARLPQVSPEVLRTAFRDLSDPQALTLRALVRGGAPEPAAAQEALARVQAAVARRPDLPQGQGDAVTQLLRGLARAPGAESPGAPETWQSWIKAGVKALSDPAVSPREAPFHAAQAKEGTALYELPLPWAPQAPLQMWVESDARGKGRTGKDGGETRVLLGLNFTRLGETRLGIAKGAAGLQVRVWAQHPEALQAAQPGMEEELKALGLPVDLKILPLEDGPVPSIRSLAAGSTFQVLG